MSAEPQMQAAGKRQAQALEKVLPWTGTTPPGSPQRSPLGAAARRMSEEDALHGMRGVCIRDKVGLPKKEVEEPRHDEERVVDTADEMTRMLAELEEEAAALQRDNELESLSPRRKPKAGLSGLISGMIRGKGPTPFEPKETTTIRRGSLKVEETLGEGSCAMVCRASWRGMPVAAKLLKEEAQYKRKGSTLDEARDTLLKEIEMMTKFNHPHMVGVVGICDEQGPLPVLVQDLMACSLKQYYDRKNPNPQAAVWRPDEYLALRWCWGLAQAVSFLHSLTPIVIHRDVKPDNIMLDGDNNIKLGDLGLSRHIPKKSRSFMGSKKKHSYRMTGDTGSLRYMAPEVLDVDADGMAFYNESVDVYSSAMVMFFIVAGEIPFVAHRAREAAKRAILGFRPSLKHLANDSPHELLTMIKACWAHEHTERPAMDDVATKLSELKRNTHEKKANALIEKINVEGGEAKMAERARSLSICSPSHSRSNSPVRRGPASPSSRSGKAKWLFGGKDTEADSDSKAAGSSFLEKAKSLSRSVSPFRRSRRSNSREDVSVPGQYDSGPRLSSPISVASPSEAESGEFSMEEGSGPEGQARSGRSRGGFRANNAPKERLSSGI